jgi:chromosome segregation ATPase
LQKRLIENKGDDKIVTSLTKDVSMRKLELDDLESEMKALLQFNHTQFLAIKENDKQQQDIDIQIESLEEERKTLNSELIEANESFNMQEISSIQEKLAVVKDKIRELTMPVDPLLGVLEDEDGDPFIEK